MPKITSNESKNFDANKATKHFEVYNNYMEEDERLNVGAWKYFDELTTIVKKIDRLNDIIIQIQEVLMPLMMSRSPDAQAEN